MNKKRKRSTEEFIALELCLKKYSDAERSSNARIEIERRAIK